MGRYFEDRVSTGQLDPANPAFGPLRQAATAVNTAETAWYERRREVFDELDFGGFGRSAEQVERRYANLVAGVSVYEFTDTFNRAGATEKDSTDNIRFVKDTFELTNIVSGFSDERFIESEEDDDGDTSFIVADDVLEYQVGSGKRSVDTLYESLAAFSSSDLSRTTYYEFIDDDDPGHVVVNDVFRGFGEVPHRYNATAAFTSQQLQVMRAAGADYDAQVGGAIAEYERQLDRYGGDNGGDLVSNVHRSDDPDFQYEGYDGSTLSSSYNRPGELNRRLIRQVRGFL